MDWHSAADCKRDPASAGAYGWLSDVDETATSLVAAIRTLRKGHSVAPGLAKLAQISAARWTQLDVLEPKLHDIAVNKEVSAGDRADIQREIQLTSLVADDLLRDLRVKVWAAVDEGELAADPMEILRLFPRRSERRKVAVVVEAVLAAG